MPSAAILVERLGFSYHKRRAPVLADVSFSVAAGGVTALVGRSGTGKSSLLHLIAGLARPNTGQVVIDGIRVDRPSQRAVMMFQSPSLYPWLSVADNVGIGLRFARLPKSEITRKVDEALALVGLAGQAGQQATEISGGQAQRAALARSLVMEPEVLLLDEPFAALDLFTRRDLQRDVRVIALRLGITVLLVSHDIPEIARMADFAVFLAGAPARVVASSPISDAARAETGAMAEIARLQDLYERSCAPGRSAPAMQRLAQQPQEAFAL